MPHQVHDKVVFYKDQSKPGHRFRQIIIIEKDHYEVRIYEGELILTEPQSVADDEAEVYFNDTLEQARVDLQRGIEKALNEGWKIYGRK